jgi:hypothetical protein
MKVDPPLRHGRHSHVRLNGRAVTLALLASAFALTAFTPSLQAHDVVSYNANLLGRTGKVTWGMWSWTDGVREYALMCTRQSLQVIDVTDPTNPYQVADVPSVSGDMRIVRAYDQYAYATNQNGPMQIIDLSDPDNIRTVATYESEAVQGAHTIQIFGQYAYLSLWGVGTEDFRILDLSDPLAPVEVGYYRHPAQGPLQSAPAPALEPDCSDHDCSKGCMNIPQHPTVIQALSRRGGVAPQSSPPSTLGPFPIMAHDCYVRGDTAYVAFGGGGFVVLDLSDRSNPVELEVVEYNTSIPGTHTVWLNDPGTHLFVTDEYAGGHLHTWDVQDIENISHVGEWQSHPDRIIHNVYVEDDLAFLAYYTDGLRVLDISEPADPIEVAFYDFHDGPSGAYYEGAFAAYPWTNSGAVLVSDMKNGLHLIDVDRTARGGWVEGDITEFITDSPIEGAVVLFVEMGRLVESDASGHFRAGLPEGTHTVEIQHYGHRPMTLSVNVTEDLTTDVERQLIPIPFGRLRIEVRGGDNGTPLERAAMEVPELPGGVRYADENGLIDWGWVPGGTYTPVIGRWGYVPHQMTLEVSSDPRHSPFEQIIHVQSGFFDDCQFDQGWSLSDPDDDATDGWWVRGDPSPSWTLFPRPASPDWDADVTPYGFAFHTGQQLPDQIQFFYDVDGGKTTLTSPLFDLRGYPDPGLSYARWFSNDTWDNPGEDPFIAEISNDDGQTWVLLEELWISDRSWVAMSYRIRDFVEPTDKMRLRFIAQDRGGDSVVEAGIDRVSISGTVIDVPSGVTPLAFGLSPPYPNPAPRAQTVIRFSLPSAALDCRVEVIDVRGRRIRVLAEGPRPAGQYAVDLRGGEGAAEFRSGLYWVRLLADGRESIEKLVVVH